MLLQQTTIKALTMVLMLALVGARTPGVGRVTPSPEFVISANEVAIHLSYHVARPHHK
jgi:hypothetical protein